MRTHVSVEAAMAYEMASTRLHAGVMGFEARRVTTRDRHDYLVGSAVVVQGVIQGRASRDVSEYDAYYQEAALTLQSGIIGRCDRRNIGALAMYELESSARVIQGAMRTRIQRDNSSLELSSLYDTSARLLQALTLS